MRPRTKLIDLNKVLSELPDLSQDDRLSKLDLAAMSIEKKYFHAVSGSVFTFKPDEDELALANYLMYSLRIGRTDLVRRALVELYHRVRAEQKVSSTKEVKL